MRKSTRKNLYIILLLLFFLVGVVLFYFLNIEKDSPSNQNNDSISQIGEVEIQEDFATKIVYTSDVDQDKTMYQQHCEDLGGNFKNCGNLCAPDADMCAAVCAFTCEDIPQDDAKDSETKNSSYKLDDEIYLETPLFGSQIESPLEISGEARGTWFSEASFPVLLTDWDGKIIAKTLASTESNWMTWAYVPFSATLEFDNPYKRWSSDFMKNGNLILQKATPSGLPENDKALEIRIQYK